MNSRRLFQLLKENVMIMVVIKEKVMVIFENHFSVTFKQDLVTSHIWMVKEKRVKTESRISAWRIKRKVIYSFIQQTFSGYGVPDITVLGLGGVAVNKIDKNTPSLKGSCLTKINKEKCVICQIVLGILKKIKEGRRIGDAASGLRF